MGSMDEMKKDDKSGKIECFHSRIQPDNEQFTRCDACLVVMILILAVGFFFLIRMVVTVPYAKNRLNGHDESVVIRDTCHVVVEGATIQRQVNLSCSETPMVGLPKIDSPCDGVSAGDDPKIYCDSDNNGYCAPYCFETRVRFGSKQLFRCTWDASESIINVTISITPVNNINKPGQTTFSYNETSIVSYESYAEIKSYKSVMNAAFDQRGMTKLEYCAYVTDDVGNIIDGRVDLYVRSDYVVTFYLIVPLFTCMFITYEFILCAICKGGRACNRLRLSDICQDGARAHGERG